MQLGYKHGLVERAQASSVCTLTNAHFIMSSVSCDLVVLDLHASESMRKAQKWL
jgi:hypothetical protein